MLTTCVSTVERMLFRVHEGGACRGARPFVAEVIGPAYNAFGQFIEVRRPMGAVRSGTVSWNVQRAQLVEDRIHRAIGIAQEDAAPHARKSPSEPLEHGLSLQVITELFEREVSVPIALDGQVPAVPFHDQIDAPRANLPPWNGVVAGLNQTLHDIALKGRLDVFFFVVERPHEEFGGLRVLNEPSPEVAGLEVRSWIQGVNNPHLVSRPAGGHIEPLLKHLLVTKVEGIAYRGIHDGQENYISLVSLKLRGRSTQQTMPFVQVGGKVRSQEAVDFQSLLLSH